MPAGRKVMTMKLLDVKEAAEFLKLGVSTMNKLRVHGGGPAYHKLGARVLYAEADLQKYLAQNRQVSTAQNKSAAAVRAPA
jgi:excisionase family DNA binding protein